MQTLRSSRGVRTGQSARARDLSTRLVKCSASVAEPSSSKAAPQQGARVTKALKEWAPTIEALGHGEQTVLFRKGGIKEPTFRPEAGTFLLFPTAFHTDQQLLKPGVAERYAQAMALDPKKEAVLALPYVAEVTGAWTTHDPAVLTATDDLHVWTEQFIETRLKWRSSQPLTVLELRVWRLAAPLQLHVEEGLFGCFSWVDVTQTQSPVAAVDLTGAVPAVADAEFARRQARLRQALAGLKAEKLEL
ncbi:hypothetical protein HYH02_010710 [Chlamydomonas schloesseri]|uniref:Uncharacterized protein n=1 Tax=Chlamydomonas schloesseri TaxID=2026947 RepID=A0A835THN8_9CHLO|nr:hypothetical protein HYH02_010710 [Chlamydomonas schloesseri]|eukprot:KAG2438915.1 hypothetical protein HYH02_010710 [Chlamydomonas schloesseri]